MYFFNACTVVYFNLKPLYKEGGCRGCNSTYHIIAEMEKNELPVETPSVLKQSSFKNIKGFDCVDLENGNDHNRLGNATSDKVRN